MNNISTAIACFAVASALSHASAHASPANGAVGTEIGVMPESLVLAGIATAQCSTADTLLGRIDSATAQCNDIFAAHTALESTGNTLASLEESIMLAPDDQTLADALHAAQSAYESAQQTLATEVQDLQDYVLENVDSQSMATLQRVHANAVRQVPAEFRVLDLSASEWRAVERALRAESRAQRTDEPLDPAQTQLLQDIRSEIDVIDAKYRLDAHLTAVETAFEQFESD